MSDDEKYPTFTVISSLPGFSIVEPAFGEDSDARWSSPRQAGMADYCHLYYTPILGWIVEVRPSKIAARNYEVRHLTPVLADGLLPDHYGIRHPDGRISIPGFAKFSDEASLLEYFQEIRRKEKQLGLR
jgi:hypothetical protein